MEAVLLVRSQPEADCSLLFTALFSQASGNQLVSNYLTQILKDTGLKTEYEITLVNGMVTLWQYIVSLAVTLMIDRFKRRFFFVTGSAGVLVTFVVWTIASQRYIELGDLAAGRLVLACIFISKHSTPSLGPT